MANWSVRNIGIACAAFTTLVAVVMLSLHLHNHHSQTAAANAQPVSQAHKPSPYGEAFRPSTIQGHTFQSPRVVASSANAYSTAQPLPVVAPKLMATHLISAPPPAYPMLARMAHVRGRVTVEALISSSGTVSAARALDGHHLLRGAAEAAVRQRRYRPYRIGGQAVNVSTLITVDFGDPS